MLFIKIDSNPGPLVLEATALLTVPRNDPSKWFEIKTPLRKYNRFVLFVIFHFGFVIMSYVFRSVFVTADDHKPFELLML